MNEYIKDICLRSKNASFELQAASEKLKNQALLNAAEYIEKDAELILEANEEDISRAVENGIRPAMVDRLKLSKERIKGICNGIREVAELPDPVGEILGGGFRPNGIEIVKKRVPIGVIGIVFESRPNVTADCAALTIKSGNCAILRGGKEAVRSNIAIANSFRRALLDAGLPEDSVILIENTDRALVNELLSMKDYIDVIIPRGGHGLITTVVENSKIPVIRTGEGNCHTYIDECYDKNIAIKVAVNAKTQRPSVCNAMETLLVSEKAAPEFIPEIVKVLREKNVEIRGCEKTKAICEDVISATDLDYATEFDDLILAVKVVRDVDEAIEHINKYGTGHSEAIITKDIDNAAKFQRRVDCACVYVNCSTRFTDGNEFGFGAEIGISNQKIHARGPMGLKELTSVKYFITGNGQIRE